jgi:hypothetical protein
MSEPTATTAEPDFGPSLPQLLRRWIPRLARWQQLLLAAALVALLVFLGTALYKTEAAKKDYVQTAGDARERGLEPTPTGCASASRAAPTCEPSAPLAALLPHG